MTVSYTIVLVEEDGDRAGDTPAWLPIGELVVPMGTQRKTVLRKLLEGQTRDGEGGEVPQIPLDAGERGGLLLIPTLELGDVVPVSARETIVFEVIA